MGNVKEIRQNIFPTTCTLSFRFPCTFEQQITHSIHTQALLILVCLVSVSKFDCVLCVYFFGKMRIGFLYYKHQHMMY